MDFGFCGIIDIVIGVLFLIVILVGYHKGFLKKAIGLIGLFVGLVVAFTFCTQLADCFEANGIIYDSLFNNVYQSVMETEIFQNGAEQATIGDVLKNIGVPDLFINMFAKNIDAGSSATVIAANIARYFAHTLTVIICFFILFVGVFIMALVLKLISAVLRGNAIIKFVDGILGVVLYGCLFLLFLDIGLTVVRFMENASFFASCKEFLDVDMKLLEPNTFRLSKYLYQHNIIYGILDIFF